MAKADRRVATLRPGYDPKPKWGALYPDAGREAADRTRVLGRCYFGVQQKNNRQPEPRPHRLPDCSKDRQMK
jgi:hypothetical protein